LGYPIAKKYRILETILNSTFIILFWAIQLPSRQKNRKLTETQEGLFFFFPLSSSVCSLLWFFFLLLLHFLLPPRTSDFFQFCDVAQTMTHPEVYIFSQIYLFFDI
jgi:hypothetical protein